MSCAADSMLRRSWLIRATAMPSSASRLRWREFVRERALHGGERRLGAADLVVAPARAR